MKQATLRATVTALLLSACATADRAAVRVQSAAQAQASPTLSTGDTTFINAAAQLGIATVTFSQLARTEASRTATRDLATRLAASHTTINQELDKLAVGGRVAPDLSLDATHQLAYAKLEGLRGRAFDRAYLDQLATDHAAMLALFRAEAAGGTDPKAKALAARILPDLERRAATIRALGGRPVPAQP